MGENAAFGVLWRFFSARSPVDRVPPVRPSRLNRAGPLPRSYAPALIVSSLGCAQHARERRFCATNDAGALHQVRFRCPAQQSFDHREWRFSAISRHSGRLESGSTVAKLHRSVTLSLKKMLIMSAGEGAERLFTDVKDR